MSATTHRRSKARAVATRAGQANKRRNAGQTADHSSEWGPAQTLTDQAYRELEEEITTLRIPPGTVVSEAYRRG